MARGSRLAAFSPRGGTAAGCRITGHRGTSWARTGQALSPRLAFKSCGEVSTPLACHHCPTTAHSYTCSC